MLCSKSAALTLVNIVCTRLNPLLACCCHARHRAGHKIGGGQGGEGEETEPKRKLVLNLKFQVITDLVTQAGYHRLPRGYHRPARKMKQRI